MKKPKLLTIAIATYNMEDYLPLCVDSLLVLTDMDCMDILIVNDGSFDTSLEIAKEYEAKYPGIVRVLDKQNGGYGSAVNMAIDQAKGKYFKTLDADDRFDKEGFIRYISKLNNIYIRKTYKRLYRKAMGKTGERTARFHYPPPSGSLHFRQ